jgi:ATP-binding cassette, subfamily F, member 3
MLLEATKLSVNFGQKQVLKDVDLKITVHSRIGLIGVNGAGKSTLLKCLMGEITNYQGAINKADNLQIRCLTQNPELTPGNTLEEELYSVFTRINELKQKEEAISLKLGELSPEDMEKALNDLTSVHEELNRIGAYTLDEKIGRMVTGLGFSLDQLKHPVDKFSGGWQMRINLAKVLLQEADIILMDEPTNHLDMEACEWLEEFLRSYPKGIVVVSHDRRFLDEVVTEIAELERGELTLYHGNYTDYVEQRNALRDHLGSAAQRQQKFIKEQMDFVNKFRASARKSTQAKSREKQLAKLEIIEAPKSDMKRLAFKFPLAEPSGTDVLRINGIAKSFDGKFLYRNVFTELEWNKEKPPRVFILGANGCGKTTLFKMLMGIEKPDEGSIEFGKKVQLGYYAQHQLQVLDPNKSILKTLEDDMPPTPVGEIRGILGRFLFTGEEVFKNVAQLSGGEKARLAIAKLMVSGPNTLLLDEPTNHLDTNTQEAVENALRDYQGSVICISHDRYLIHKHATHIWEFHNGTMISFDGSYEYYLEKRNELLKLTEKNNPNLEKESSIQKQPSQYQLHQESKAQLKHHKKLEKEISKLISTKALIEEKLCDPNIGSDYKALEELNDNLKKLNTELDQKESEWIKLGEKLEVTN